MTKRHANPRLAKIHRNYTVAEAASCFSVHRGTVRKWIEIGLSVCDELRPVLILGRDLRSFLEAKRQVHKRPCQPCEIYCFRCRAAKRPAGDMADYLPSATGAGKVVGLCPDCGTVMNRRVSTVQLAAFRRELDVSEPKARLRIGDTQHPCVNSDIKSGA